MLTSFGDSPAQEIVAVVFVGGPERCDRKPSILDGEKRSGSSPNLL
jgi:hypothetical protein